MGRLEEDGADKGLFRGGVLRGEDGDVSLILTGGCDHLYPDPAS